MAKFFKEITINGFSSYLTRKGGGGEGYTPSKKKFAKD